MGSIVMIPSDVRFGVMYTKNKHIISHDGFVYGFGEAPEATYTLEVAKSIYDRMISEGHTESTITLFIYSKGVINDEREPFPVDEGYYSRDAMFSACYPEYQEYILVSENH